jgi:hypothetical protein
VSDLDRYQADQHPHVDHHDDDVMLRPSKAAQMFAVRVATLARWAREGHMVGFFTPGGHRRYLRSGVCRHT